MASTKRPCRLSNRKLLARCRQGRCGRGGPRSASAGSESMTGCHRGREHIARAAHGLDEGRLLAVVLQALAQAADLHVQRAVQGPEVAAAGDLGEAAAVQHLAGVFHQQLEQLEVHARQRGGGAVGVGEPALQQVQREAVEVVEARLPGPVLAGAAGDGLDAGQQLARVEGLAEVVVGTQLQADDAVGLVGAGGQHDDGHLGAAAHRLAQREAFGVGQHHVEDAQADLVAVALELGHEAGAVMGQQHLVLVLLKVGLEQAADFLVVVDDQDLARSHEDGFFGANARSRPCSLRWAAAGVWVGSSANRWTVSMMAFLPTSLNAMRCTRLGTRGVDGLANSRKDCWAQGSSSSTGTSRRTGMEPLMRL
mmetsp:Transcript_16163/g.30510  ORF Transcript_16163/g.30510 Transcript_16163/m.30510 type:complete len:366 (-) Transcript_16163:133-1230(-)